MLILVSDIWTLVLDMIWTLVSDIWTLVSDIIWTLVWDMIWTLVSDMIWTLVSDMIWTLVSDMIWTLVSDMIWTLVSDMIWTLVLDMIWTLVSDMIWTLVSDMIWTLVLDMIWTLVLDMIWMSCWGLIPEMSCLNRLHLAQQLLICHKKTPSQATAHNEPQTWSKAYNNLSFSSHLLPTKTISMKNFTQQKLLSRPVNNRNETVMKNHMSVFSKHGVKNV